MSASEFSNVVVINLTVIKNIKCLEYGFRKCLDLTGQFILLQSTPE